MDIKRFFENKDNYIKIEFHAKDERVQQAIKFAKHMASIKKGQSNFKTDNRNIEKRFMTGALTEIAVERALGIEFADLEIRYNNTESKFHDIPDLKNIGYNVGVKASDIYQLPLIKAYNTYDQIICFREDKKNVYICGVATSEVLNEHQSEDFVLSPILRKFNNEKREKGEYASRYIKTAFTGFDYFIDFKEYFNIKSWQQ